MITAEQIKAARALLRMEEDELARRASVSIATIRRLETAGNDALAEVTAIVVQAALQEAGVEFIVDGVCLKSLAQDADALFDRLLAIATESARQLEARPPAGEASPYGDDGLPA